MNKVSHCFLNIRRIKIMNFKNLFKSKKKTSKEAEVYLLEAIENYEKAVKEYDELVTKYATSFLMLKNSMTVMNKFLDDVIKTEQGDSISDVKFKSVQDIEDLAVRIQTMNNVNINFISKLLNGEDDKKD